jgi:RNA polymerase sigma factor (sigma-70 family)
MSTIALAHRGREVSAVRTDGQDVDLVAAVRRGDDTAFEHLYQRYHGRVTAYVARMVGCREHAEEIAQEAFISALRRLRETEQAIAFKAWIYGIARNGAIDHLRARSRRGTEVGFDNIEGIAEPRHMTSPSPDAAVESKQALRDLQGAFGGLSEAHHQILLMRELEGLSYDQIGERLDMTRSQVESTLFRARRRLEEEYEELVTGQRCVRVQAIIGRGNGAAVGVRDERRVERHLSHCSSCRKDARRARLVAVAAA